MVFFAQHAPTGVRGLDFSGLVLETSPLPKRAPTHNGCLGLNASSARISRVMCISTDFNQV